LRLSFIVDFGFLIWYTEIIFTVLFLTGGGGMPNTDLEIRVNLTDLDEIKE
jgi:hypothetical protein